MPCSSCGKKTSNVKYELTNPDGSGGTYDTRSEAEADRLHGGKIRTVLVSS